MILLVQLLRLIWRVLWFALTHPAANAVAALVVVTLLGLGWPGVVALAAAVIAALAGLRVLQPVWFARFVAVPVLDWFRWWFYRRRWKAAMTLAGLAPDYREQPMLPVLNRVRRAGAVDLVRVGLVTGQARPTSRPGPRTWPTPSAPGCAASAPTPSPTPSAPCPSPARWISPG